LPKDVVIKQFHHIRQDDVNTLLEHWTSRQAAGKVPLRFKKAVKGIRQNIHTSEENSDDDADVEPDEDNDDNDDAGANRDSQAPENGAPQEEGESNNSTGQDYVEQGLVGWFLKHSYGRC